MPNNQQKNRYKGIRCFKDSFYWLLEQMSLFPELKIDPESFRILETAVWRFGKPTCILRYDGLKMNKLTSKKMSKRFVQLHFCAKQNDFQIYGNSVFSVKHSSRPMSAKTNVFTRLSLVKKKDIDLGLPEKILLDEYKAILKLKPQGALGLITTKLITEKTFVDILTKWNSTQLREILSIQEFVQLDSPNPLIIRIKFIAELPISGKDNHIDYSIEPNYPMLPKNEFEERYRKCYKIVQEICMRFSKYNKIEILELKAEFFTSENLFYLTDASNIIWRIKKNMEPRKEDPQKFHVMNEAFKNCLVKRLDGQTENIVKARDREVIFEGMRDTINDQVSNIRETTGINDLLTPEPTDHKSDVVFEKLRPECPYKLTDLLNNRFITKKSIFC